MAAPVRMCLENGAHRLLYTARKMIFLPTSPLVREVRATWSPLRAIMHPSTPKGFAGHSPGIVSPFPAAGILMGRGPFDLPPGLPRSLVASIKVSPMPRNATRSNAEHPDGGSSDVDGPQQDSSRAAPGDADFARRSSTSGQGFLHGRPLLQARAMCVRV